MKSANDPKVSIIVPVYNASGYLREAMGNVIDQTLQDMEIIMVDDASTDDSRSKLREYKERYPDKIVLIECDKNHGAGGARNIALDAAKGEYIGFFDADDMIKKDMYEKLYNKAVSGDYDLVDTGFYDEKKDFPMIFTTDEMTGDLDDKKRSAHIAAGGYLWTKLIKRDIICGENKVRFRENSILEDADFLFYLYCVVSRIGNVKDILYVYCDRETSASKVRDAAVYTDNIKEAMKAIHLRVEKLAVFDGVREAVEYAIIQMYSYGVVACVSSFMDGESAGEVTERLKELRSVKDELVGIPYDDNKYIKRKMSAQDIDIIKWCDKDIAALLEANRE